MGEEDKEKGKTEEIDITDLVKSQKNVEKKQEEYFDNLFKHLDDLESKLGRNGYDSYDQVNMTWKLKLKNIETKNT